MENQVKTEPLTPAPWDRFGWVMAVIWLFFLAFPIYDALIRDGWQRAWGLATIVLFAALYTFGFVRFPRIAPSQRTQNWALVGLVVIAGAAAIVLGPVALTFVPFVTAFGVYFQPVRRSIALSAMWVVLTILVVAITNTWATLGVVIGIVAVVAIVTFVPRWLDEQQQAYFALQSEFERIAQQERVARDVHDVLGHSLTVIAVKAELAGRLLERAAATGDEDEILDGAASEVAAIESLSRQALSEIRATVAGMRVARLDAELISAKEALASAGVELGVSGEAEELDPRYRLIAGWVLREAVTNIVRHAEAKNCWVNIEDARISITDDGRGIGTAIPGLGIEGLSERVQMGGGALSVTNTSSGGTCVEAQW